MKTSLVLDQMMKLGRKIYYLPSKSLKSFFNSFRFFWSFAKLLFKDFDPVLKRFLIRQTFDVFLMKFRIYRCEVGYVLLNIRVTLTLSLKTLPLQT
jgi:hypothetical protein